MVWGINQAKEAIVSSARNWMHRADGWWKDAMERGEEQKSGVDCFSL